MSGTGSGNSVGSHADGHGRSRVRWTRKAKIVSAAAGVLLAGGGAYAATNWTVGLAGGSSGEGQSATVSNLTIAAVASPAASNVLYPGGSGDVVLTISNPNAFPVTVTGVNLPTNTTYATGYTTSALATTQAAASPPPRAMSSGTSPLRLRAALTPSRPRSPSPP